MKAEGIVALQQIGGQKRKSGDEVVKGGEEEEDNGVGIVKKRRGRKLIQEDVASQAGVAMPGIQAAETEPVKKRRGRKPRVELAPGTGLATAG